MAKKKVTIIINEGIHATLKKLAVDKNKKISDLYEDVLKEGLRIYNNQSTLEEHEVKVE